MWHLQAWNKMDFYSGKNRQWPWGLSLWGFVSWSQLLALWATQAWTLLVMQFIWALIWLKMRFNWPFSFDIFWHVMAGNAHVCSWYHCHTAIVLLCTSVIDLYMDSSTSPPTSGHTEVSYACLSPAVWWRGSCINWPRTRLQVQMVPVPGSGKHMLNSFVGFYSTSSTLARVRTKFQCCGRCPALFWHLKIISCICPQWLQTSCSNIPHHESSGETVSVTLQ